MLKKILLPLIIILNTLCFSFSITEAQTLSFKDIATYKINKKNEQYFLEIKLEEDYFIYSNIAKNFNNSIIISAEHNSNLKNFHFHLPPSNSDKFEKLYYKDLIIIPLEIELHEPSETNIIINIQLTLCKEYCILHNGKVKLELNNSTSHNFLISAKVLIFAFLGGIFLNFMPCVLPIITLKIYQISLLNNKDNKNINSSLIGTIAGIQITMLVLAMIVFFLKSSGEIAGLGFHFQEANFIITLIIFSLIITLTSTNDYYYNLSTIINKVLSSSKIKLEQNFLSGIVNGIFIALISTPCTAPFLGIATGYALSCSNIMLFLIYINIGIGLAFIYFLILFNKNIITYIPKSLKISKFLGKLSKISLYSIIIWLIFILNGLTSLRVTIIIFGLCILFKFIVLNQGNLSKNKIIQYLLLFLIIISMYLIPMKIKTEHNISSQIVNKFWQNFDQKLINDLILQNNIVIIDVTADWCITCKINHLTTLDNINVINILQQSKVKGFKADITKDTPEYIHQLMNKFNRYGIPLNILYDKNHPDGILLDILLYPSDLLKYIE